MIAWQVRVKKYHEEEARIPLGQKDLTTTWSFIFVFISASSQRFSSAVFWRVDGLAAVTGNQDPITVGEVVVVENSLKNRTLWVLARVNSTNSWKRWTHQSRSSQKLRLGNWSDQCKTLQSRTARTRGNFTKDLTDSVIRTRRGRKVTTPKRLTYA
ncbi:hypothetical protein TNIN_81701 [Trichonephila inaurata madagascariensis]|uniref:Uncharacterized protein n=1 Tax=Trichonephila inaurata madagascariensis TaxID=2747483 RepID=A0A8X7C1K0_9ARAC|nr:hypothetical protein TNIN_81701 [Trichonephila inaurata madagascariensis]